MLIRKKIIWMAMSVGAMATAMGSRALAGDKYGAGGKEASQHFISEFDKNKDGLIQMTELPERMRSHLGPADTNKDNVLNQAEIEAWKAKHPHHGYGKMMMRPEDLQARFDTNKDGKLQLSELPEHKREKFSGADANKDGVLSTEEMTAHMVAKKKEWFGKLDKNADGAVTQNEVDRPGKWEHLQKADTNKDGRVTVAEMEQAIKSGALSSMHGDHCEHVDHHSEK